MKQGLKTVGYLLFAFIVYIDRIFTKVNKNKVFCVMTHDSSMDSNVGIMIQTMKRHNQAFQFIKLTKESSTISLFLQKTYHMATAKYILMDNTFLPMSYLHFPKSVKVVQLWHGTGTIKKFGQDFNTGQLRKLEYKANQSITHLIVNSKAIKRQYAKAFGVPLEKTYATGLPRTDLLFDKNKEKRDIEEFYKLYPELRGKKLVLYAPTFRDAEVNNPISSISYREWVERLPDDCICLLKFHPFVANNFMLSEEEQHLYGKRIWNMSSYPDTNTLLLVADVLITDYSSIIYEYCLRKKPMIFFAYDLKMFEQAGRGFYEPYESFVPGMVVNNMHELIRALNESLYSNTLSQKNIEEFCNKYYDYTDGGSAERIYQLIVEERMDSNMH